MGLRTKVTRITLSTGSRLGILLSPFPECKNVFDVFTAPCSFFLRGLQMIKRVEGCLNHIQHIGTTLRLGQNIAYASYFKDGAHTTSCDNPSSRRSRFQHYSSTSNLP